LIGEDFTLEGLDVPGELLSHRLIGPDFQDIFAGVAGSGGMKGLTQESGGSGWMERKTGGLQRFDSVKRKL
jgi:hypothetical protein